MKKPASVYPETRIVVDPPYEALYTPSYELGQPGYKYSQNVFGAIGRGFGLTGWGFAKDQWSGVVDHDTRPLTAEELKEIPDNELIEFQPWMTRGQVQRQIDAAKRQQYIDAHRSSWHHHVAGFVGALPTVMLAPEVLVTLPVGGPAFAAAARAPTLYGMAAQSLKSAAQVSAASVPANIVAQQMTYGQVNNTELALVAAAPFALTPAMAAGFRAYLRRGAPAVANTGTDAGIPRNLEAQFDTYQGGLPGWLNGFMQNNAEAVAFAKSLGIDDAQLDELRAAALEQANRTAAPVDDVILQEDLQALAFGQANAEQIDRLRLRGVLPDTPEVADVLTRYLEVDNVSATDSIALLRELADVLPPELRGVMRHLEHDRLGKGGPAVDDLTIRELQDLLAAIDAEDLTNVSPELLPFAERMVEASRMAPFDRRLMRPMDDDALNALRKVASSADQDAARKLLGRIVGDMGTDDTRALLKAFRENGLDGVRLAYMKQLERDVELGVRTIGEIEAARRVTTAQIETVSAKLPKELAGAKPRYKTFTLAFESDIDRAAYITAQSKPSKRDADYLRFVMEATGMTEGQVRAHGARIREFIKTQESSALEDAIAVPAQPVRNATRKIEEPLNPEQQALVDSTLARMEQLKAEQTRLANARTNIPPEMNVEDLARSILFSQQRVRPATLAEVGPAPATPDSVVSKPSKRDDELRAWAERNGVDFDSPQSGALRIERIVEECGQ